MAHRAATQAIAIAKLRSRQPARYPSWRMRPAVTQMEHLMHWSKISLAMLRALALVGLVGILIGSSDAAFARKGHGHSKSSKIRISHGPIIVGENYQWYKHRHHKHWYPYPGKIRGPLPPVKKPPSEQGGMPAPGGAAPAPMKPPAPPAPPASGGAAPMPTKPPAPAPAPTPGGGRDPGKPPTKAQ